MLNISYVPTTMDAGLKFLVQGLFLLHAGIEAFPRNDSRCGSRTRLLSALLHTTVSTEVTQEITRIEIATIPFTHSPLTDSMLFPLRLFT